MVGSFPPRGNDLYPAKIATNKKSALDREHETRQASVRRWVLTSLQNCPLPLGSRQSLGAPNILWNESILDQNGHLRHAYPYVHHVGRSALLGIHVSEVRLQRGCKQ